MVSILLTIPCVSGSPINRVGKILATNREEHDNFYLIQPIFHSNLYHIANLFPVESAFLCISWEYSRIKTKFYFECRFLLP